jgi:hypothetical protein
VEPGHVSDVDNPDAAVVGPKLQSPIVGPGFFFFMFAAKLSWLHTILQ